ncbi:DUF3638 domain-containing protein [Candidatus Berkiella cookevillensis]|uniref:DUF3638 domain-containing protein n=1 Tax=Candidatus Berkiella cookevillensis TaxID=437022 RepID=A0A0Q9YBD5_9GAMM|nr:DUF3638 domain-containing protein [Candidatus Berkiella cookevillensis]MCS5709091.1 DUF3638 domain-containing protein [Candidatus Berkiella cookevillensis]
MMGKAITDKLFAHIQNDAYLVGSRTLEGDDFRNTISYLLEYINQLKAEENDMQYQQLLNRIEPFISKLEYLKENTIKLRILSMFVKSLTDAEMNQDPFFIEHTHKLVADINALVNESSEKNGLMIAGGWSNSDGGHAMVYEFKWDDDGNLLFIIHNSGAGLNFHNSISQEDKVRYCPIKVYKINQSDVDEERLAWFIGELIKPNLNFKSKKEITAEYLYNSIFSQIAYLNGELQDPFQYTTAENLIMGQRSGTCTEKVLHVILKNMIPDKKEYKHFIYAFKKHALDEYLKKIRKDNRMNDAGVVNQILLAIANMSRSLLKQDYFDAAKQASEMMYLKGLQKDVQRQIDASVASRNSTVDIDSFVNNDNKNITIEVPLLDPIKQIDHENRAYVASSISEKIQFDAQKTDFLLELKEFRDKIKLLATKDSVSTQLSIEDFLKHATTDLQLSIQQYNRADKWQDKKELFDIIAELNQVYVEAYQSTYKSRLTPQFYMAQLSFIAMFANIETVEQSALEPSSALMLDLVQSCFYQNIKNISEKMEFSSEDYICDKSLIDLFDFFSKRQEKSERGIYNLAESKTKKMYETLIKQQDLFEGLSEYYNEFCNKNKITESQKVYDSGEHDARALFMMQKYFGCTEGGKKIFLEDYCDFHKINSAPEKEQILQKFYAVEDCFHLQNKIELQIATAWQSMGANSDSSRNRQTTQTLIDIEQRGYTISGPLAKASKNAIHAPKTIRYSSESILEKVIQNTGLDSNKIQMSDYFRSTHSQDIKLMRELLHITKSVQPLLSVIDFFGHNLKYLNEPDILLLVEKYCFQPSTLIKAIDNRTDVIEKLDDFLNQSIHSFTKNNMPDLCAVTLHKLQVKLGLYLKQYYTEKRESYAKEGIEDPQITIELNKINNRIDGFLKYIDKQIAKDIPDIQIKASLYYQKMTILSSQLKEAIFGKEKEKLLKETINAFLNAAEYHTVQSSENLIEKDIFNQISRGIQLELNEMMEHDPSHFNQYISKIFSHVLKQRSPFYNEKVKPENAIWEIKLPYIVLYENETSKKEVVCIDLESGKISKPGLNHAKLPDRILYDPHYIKLFKDFNPTALSNTQNDYFEFDFENVHYKINISKDGEPIIYRQYDVLGSELRWYQCMDLEKINGIHTILQQNHYIAWASVEDVQIEGHDASTVLISKAVDKRPDYCYQPKNKKMIKLNEEMLDTGYTVLDKNSSLYRLVSHFEDPDFVICLEGNKGYQIELSRYQLTLSVVNINNDESSQPDWKIYLQDTEYQLDLNGMQAVIPGLKTGLVFSNQSTKKVLFSVQPFVVEADLKYPISSPREILSFEHNDFPALIDPSRRGSILADPSRQFEQKNTARKADRPDKSKIVVLDDPSRQFEHKGIVSKADKPNLSVLADPSRQFDTKFNKKIDAPNDFSMPSEEQALVTKRVEAFYDRLDVKDLDVKEDDLKNERTEYYNLVPDIHDYLRQDFYSSGKDFDYMLDPACRAKSSNYDGMCKYMEYIIDNDRLLPSTMAQGLYLSYVYLCMNDAKKSLEMLDYCEKHFSDLSGAQEEIDYIQWMIFSAPAAFKASTIKAEIETPEVLSVKLKALSFVARLKNDNPEFKALDQQQNRDEYSVELRHRCKNFYENIEQNIYALYYKYLHAERNVPSDFQLSKHDKTFLLRSIYSKNKDLLSGALGVSHRKLELQLLQQELDSLEKKASEYSTIPEMLNQQIDNIRQKLLQDKTISGNVSTVKTAVMKIQVPKAWNYGRFPSAMNVNLKNLTLNQYAEPISLLLRFPINEKRLIDNLPRIIDGIYNNDITEADLDLLRSFCEQSIKAHAQISSNTEISNAFLFSSYVFLVLKNIDKIKSIEDQKRVYKKSNELNSYEEWLESLNGMLLSISDKIDSIDYIKNESSEVFVLDKQGQTLNTKMLAEQNHQNSVLYDIPIIYDTTGMYDLRAMLSESIPEVAHLYETIESENKSLELQLANLKSEFLKNEDVENFEERFRAQSSIDSEAGQLSATVEMNKNAIALASLGNSEVRSGILEKLRLAVDTLETDCTKALDDLYTAANKNLITEEIDGSQTIIHLELLGKKRNYLSFADIQRLYLNSNLEETMQLTALKQEESIALHAKIAKYYALAIQKQQFQRICKALNDPLIKDDIGESADFEAKQAIANLGQLLTEQNLIAPEKSPALTIFQHDQNILIRSNQKENISALLEISPDTRAYDNKIIQLIMGGGKSKVLLPILALKRATGENLSIIEVPEALYKTNFADLNQISLRLFGQHAYGMHFDRQSPSDAVSLKRMFKQLKYTSVNRGYVVTTRESMASLELKYHELLNQGPTQDEKEWERQIKWLDRIIRFRTNRGDVLIDEVDSGLDNRKQINYTVGDKEAVPSHHISFIVQLYEFINTLAPMLLDELLNTESLTNETLNESIHRLAYSMIFNEKSPIYSYIPSEMGDFERDQIVKYLLNDSQSLPPYLNECSTEFRFYFNLLKGELNHLLPHTLCLKLYENYGPSFNPKKSVVEKCISIPYGGNTDPKESSKDTNHLKTINLTIQSVLTYGCSDELLINLFATWLEDAQTELLENPALRSIDNTETGKAIHDVIKKSGLSLKLSDIHLDELSALEETFNNLRLNRAFLFYVLQEEILPKMQIENKVLTHNPVNHACLYRTVQGITGTPWNWRTFYQNLKFNQPLSLGTDGLTVARLRSKNTQVYDVPYESVNQYLRGVLGKTDAPECVRAIIDVGATFRGVKNREAAHQIAQFMQEYNKQYDTNIKYVLFFDKDATSGLDEIFALPVVGTDTKAICLTGKSQSEIEKLLNCTPNEYFTYYDQRHAIGTDVKQDPRAKAIVTVDKETLKKDLCQGVMRMRGFAGAQTVDIVITPETKHAIGVDAGITLDINAIIQNCETNEINRLLSDQFTGALQKIENMLAFDLKNRILQINSADAKEKQRLHKIFEPFFIQSISEKMIESYGMIEIETDTKEILQQSAKAFFEKWLCLLDEAGIQLPGADKLKMDMALENLILTEMRNCEKRKMHSMQAGELNQTAESKQESQQQSQAHKDQRQQQEQETSSGFKLGYADAANPLGWLGSMTIDQLIAYSSETLFDTPYYDHSAHANRKARIAIPMPEMVMNPNKYDREEKQYLATSGFDENIARSYNFYRSHHHDDVDRIIPEYQKQIHAVLMIQTPEGIKAMIITHDEAKDIDALLQKSNIEEPNYIWVMNTHETQFMGLAPDSAKLHPNYKRILQQLRFYNGDLGYLQEEDLSGSWLMENFDEKMRYFEKNILPYRIVEKSKMKLLHKKMGSLHEALLRVLSSHEKVGMIAWRKEYPLLNASNVASLKAFDRFCTSINENEYLKTPEDEKFITPYYFRLILEHGSDTQFKNYVRLIDDSMLKLMIQAYINEVYIKHDYGSIIKLYNNPAFLNNTKAKAQFEKTLGKYFENPEFTADMCKYASNEEISNILSIISLEDRITLIKKLPNLTGIFSKDMSYIDMFFKGISVGVLSSAVPELGANAVSVIEDGYETEVYNFDYLLKDNEKFNYLLSHFDESYIKKIFSVNSSSAFEELFHYAIKEPDLYYDKFMTIFNLLKPTLTEKECIPIWITALKIETSIEGDIHRKVNPIAFLRSEFPENSFIAAIRKSPEVFLSLLGSPMAELHHDFIWKTINSIETDSEKYKLITSDLTSTRGWNYTGMLEIIEACYNNSIKPDLYYQLSEILLKHKLIDAMREAYFSNRLWSIESAIDNYIKLMNERPDIFLSLRDIFISNHLGEKFYLEDIIKSKLDLEKQEKYHQYFMVEQVPSKKMQTYGYDKYKSDKTESIAPSASVPEESAVVITKKIPK